MGGGLRPAAFFTINDSSLVLWRVYRVDTGVIHCHSLAGKGEDNACRQESSA